jgi:hypothetical protein
MASRGVVVTISSNLFPALLAKSRAQASAVVRSSALSIEGLAKTFAPVDTGALRASIETEMASGSLEANVHDGVFYGVFQEYGFHSRAGRWVPPQPFMTPAAELERPRFERAMRREVFQP